MAPFGWYGGKGRLVSKILPYIGSPQIYVEPFCGAASVFFHKKPSDIEILNDLDQRVVDLFKNISSVNLQHRLKFTLYSREEFRKAAKGTDNWSFFLRHTQGFVGTEIQSEGAWGRVFLCRGTGSKNMADTTNSYRGRLKYLEWYRKRLAGVKLHNANALEIIKRYDSSTTTFYLDPPYIINTRVRGKYKYECTDSFHKDLISLIKKVKGKVVLSGYNHSIYNKLGWERVEFKTACHSVAKTRQSGIQGKGSVKDHAPRTEILWVNRSIRKKQIGLF